MRITPVACVLLLLVNACGDDDSGGSRPSGGAGTGGSSGTGGAAGSSGSGGSAGSAGSAGGGAGGAGGSAGQTGKHGTIGVSTNAAMGSALAGYSTFASFLEMGPSGCDLTTHGDCAVARCDFTDPPPTTTFASAGDITVTGGIEPVTMKPSVDKTYDYASGTQQLFQGGEQLQFSAAGDDIPAFTATITAPPTLELQQPSSTPVSLQKTGDFVAAWTPVSDAVVEIEFSLQPSATEIVNVRCSFDASAGTGTIPASIVSELPSGTSGDMNIALVRSPSVAPGAEWIIAVYAEHEALPPNGDGVWDLAVE